MRRAGRELGNTPGVDHEVPIAIVDIDGVVADVRHRLHHITSRPKDWDAFFDAAADDPPHAEGLAVVRRLADDHEIIYLTGRPERLRAATIEWLGRHGIGGHQLMMRSDGDRRPAARVKVELLRRLSRERTVSVVVDDDAQVLAAVRHAGFRTFPATWERRAPDAAEALEAAQERDGRT
jgi:phosphoglycolate phosphatase-like HAD superfamily hydrolase